MPPTERSPDPSRRSGRVPRALIFTAAALGVAPGISCGDDVSSAGPGGSGGTTTTSGSSTAGTTDGGGGGTGGGSGGGGPTGCKNDIECPGEVCDFSTGDCVPCTPQKDVCSPGQWCTPANECQVGCTGELDCNTVTKCDTEKHTCVGCLIDTDCPQGSICVGDTCIQGCSGMQPCQPGFTCCGQLCFDLASDEQNCGMCNSACPILAHSTSLCEESSCTLGVCDAGWKDCNLDPDDGCEQNTLTDGPCVCAPGEKQACYTGAPGTAGVGVCHAGESTCLPSAAWGPCEGQVIPTYEQCNQLDDDCDGAIERQPCEQCIPGTGSCTGDVGHACEDDGLGFAEEVCDPLQGTTCNPSTGRCDGACGLSALGQSYIGCDYFPTVTANVVAEPFHFGVAVSNTTGDAASVTVTKGAATIATAVVAPDSVQLLQLPWEPTLKGPGGGLLVPFPASVKVTQGAYRLRSTRPVTVYQFNPIEYAIGAGFSLSNDASILLPVNVWTGKYRVAARHHFSGVSGYYYVTAREDGTTVTTLPGPGGGFVKLGIPGLQANGTGTFTLNAGDVAAVVTAGGNAFDDPNDVTGTLVAADKPVQVIGGHQCVYVPFDVPYCDHIEENIFPEETLSTKYLVTPPLVPTGGSAPKVQMVRIVATKPGTNLAFDPPQPGVPTLIASAGAWLEIAGTAADFGVTASEPVLVVQYMTGQNAGGTAGDPAMTIAVGTEQFRKSYLFHAPVSYETSYVNVVAKTGVAVHLDGADIPAAAFTAIGGTGYSVARSTLSNGGSGNHTISSADEFGISVYGYGQYTSYWYPGGSNLTKLHE